jgi:serine protease Do
MLRETVIGVNINTENRRYTSYHAYCLRSALVFMGFVLRLTTVFLAPVLSLLLPVSTVRADLPDTIDSVRSSVVGVGAAYPQRQPIGAKRRVVLSGTGFVVGNGRLVITNDHVVRSKLDRENKQRRAVFSGRGSAAVTREARVLLRDQVHDLALLGIEGDPLPALLLSDSDSLREGELVAFTGFPIGAVLGLYPVTHTGIISSITPIVRAADAAKHLDPVQLARLRDPYDVLQLDAVAYPGNSGSPVYRVDSGEVVGVINGVLVKESKEAMLSDPSGISYAIPVAFVRALLEKVQNAK